MRLKTRFAALCALPLLLAGPAKATQSLDVHVNVAAPDKDGKVLVILDATHTKAACAVYDNAYSIDASTAGGQAILSAIYTAIAADLAVDIVGSGACTDYTSAESIGSVSLHRRGH
jgi:hypothetical protein